MVINTNISAANSAWLLGQASQALSKSLARLSSGSKITSPADDSAGLGVSMKLNAQIARNNAAHNNVANALSFSQTQDGYLQKIGDALSRMSELSVLAQDVTKTTTDRSLYNQEFQSLTNYINDVAQKDFNGVSLFGGNALNVASDSDGGSFAMTGISGNYVTPGVTTTTTTNAPPAGNATLASLSSTFTVYSSNGFGLSNPDNSTAGNYQWFDSSATINDFVNLFNSNGSLSSASYNASTGQFSFTVNSGKILYDQNNCLVGLGFTGGVLQANGNMLYGDGTSPSLTFTTTLPQVSTTTTTTTYPMDLSTVSGAASALSQVKSAINQLASDRATVGTNMERLNYSAEQLNTLNQNLSSASSRITDVDVTAESTNYAHANILVQAGTAMLAQANSQPQSVLRLLG